MSDETKGSPVPTGPELSQRGSQVPKSATPNTEYGSYSPKEEIDKLYKWLYAIVIVVVLAFFYMLFDFIKEKEVIINYGNLSDKYFERYLDLNNSFWETKNQCSIKDQKVSLLEEENKEILNIINCLKTKEYWQFSQCFK